MKKLTYRVQHIPPSISRTRLKEILETKFLDDKGSPVNASVDIVRSCFSGSTKNALVHFETQPHFLKRKEEEVAGIERTVAVEWGSLSIDSHFSGLTRIDGYIESEHQDEVRKTLDVVFITGLDGHAYGSWTSKATGVMWPRDFLTTDLPEARLMIFGYNSKLTEDTVHTFEDFCMQLLTGLNAARQCENAGKRDLILIGHSYGGRLITKVVSKCKINDSDAFHRDILRSLRCIVFLGAPHKGLDMTDVEKYLDSSFPAQQVGDARKRLVAELGLENPAASRELQDFKDLIGQDVKAQVVSIYERKASRRLLETPATSLRTGGTSKVDSEWARNGEYYHPLTESSALLGLPLWMEKRIPSDQNHSNIAKFDQRDQTYWSLLHEIKGVRRIGVWPSAVEGGMHQIARQIETTCSYREPTWIPFEALHFASPGPEIGEQATHWFHRITSWMSSSESGTLKLKSRRFGAVKHDRGFDPVMVEFRPCPQLASLQDHYMRRQAFEDTARIIMNSDHGPIQFPALPLRGISAWYTTSEPCFLFVHDAQNICALRDCFMKILKPSVEDRLRLAHQCAKAVAALHQARIWHGLLNYFNIYLQLFNDRRDGRGEFDIRRAPLMLAGFEIMRGETYVSDLVDVEVPEERVFLHPDRVPFSDWKERQEQEHDLFSLGIVMISIGLWIPFSSLKKYQETTAEDRMRDFVVKLRKQFKGDGTQDCMPEQYAEIISYCLGKKDLGQGEHYHNKTDYVVQALFDLLKRSAEISKSS